jgi:hypothetical protein
MEGMVDVLTQHGGATGIAFAWETQMLASRAANGA